MSNPEGFANCQAVFRLVIMKSLAPKCRPAARLRHQIMIQYTHNMSSTLPMSALVVLGVKYSAAYSTWRERFLEPQTGCAEEALLRREAARSASEGPARGRARAFSRATKWMRRRSFASEGCRTKCARRDRQGPRESVSSSHKMDAPKKLCFGGEPHAVRPKDPQGAARERLVCFMSGIYG